MEKVPGDYTTLYQRKYPSPTRTHVPTHMIPFYIDDKRPTEGEIEAAVRRLRRNRVGSNPQL